MKKSKIAALVILGMLMSFTLASAQIEITWPDPIDLAYKTVDMKIDTSIDVTELNLGIGGGSQNWTFNAVVDEWDVEFITMPTAGSLWENAFPTADWVQMLWQYIPEFMGFPSMVDTLWIYRSLDDGWIKEQGMGTKNALMQGSPFVYPEPSNSFPNPMNFNSPDWQEVRHFAPSFLGVANGTIDDSTDVTIDAWGTLTIPGGTYECLRLKRDEYRYIHLEPNFFFPLGFDTTLHTYTYTWITHGFDQVLSVTATETQGEAFTNALYVILADSPVGVDCDPECDDFRTLPTTFALRQNYPNPFNPATTIRYALPTPSEVELKVFTILGRNITTLETHVKAAGEHSITWEGKDRHGRSVPAGIYFYRLKAAPLNGSGTIVQTRKMILTK